MGGSSRRPVPQRERARSAEEARLLWWLRLITALTLIALLAFAVVTDILGRLLVDSSFHVEDFLIGSLLGGIIIVAGPSTLSSLRLPGGWEIRRSDREDPPK